MKTKPNVFGTLNFILLFFFCLLSCTLKKTDNKQKFVPSKPVTEVRPDSIWHVKDPFDWDWQFPDKKVILPIAISKYISKEHEPIDTFDGDINEDGIDDLLVVTRLKNEEELNHADEVPDLPRHLLVFLGKGDTHYKFLFKSTKAIPCVYCCGMSDPFYGISVNDGHITIQENCQSNWTYRSEFRFRYNSRLHDWLLDSVISETYAFDHEYYELDTTTKKDFGRVSLRKYVIDEEEK